MRLSVFVGLTLVAAPALGQEISGGTAGISETLIDDPDLNLERCDVADAINVDVRYNRSFGPGVDTNAKLLVWFEADNDTECVGDAVPGSGEELFLGEADLSTGFTGFLDGDAAIRIPRDLETEAGSDEEPVFHSQSLLTLRNACPEGVDETVTLCVGLDADGDGDIEEGDNLGVLREASGWVRYFLDTERPDRPDRPTVRPLDGRLDVRVEVSTEDAVDDIDSFRGFMRPEPEEPAERGVPCDQWGDNAAGLRSATTDVALGTTSATVTISGTNGVTYEICVYAIDDLGNLSLPSELATGTPQEECDFIECYPDGFLEPGCAATGGAPLGAVCLLLFALRRARERQ